MIYPDAFREKVCNLTLTYIELVNVNVIARDGSESINVYRESLLLPAALTTNTRTAKMVILTIFKFICAITVLNEKKKNTILPVHNCS